MYKIELRALNDAGINIDIAIPDVDVNAVPLASRNIPSDTFLHPNYPNPFNPETWIPYQLANDSYVQILIYHINGVLVRQLDLGHQRAAITQIGVVPRIGMVATDSVNGLQAAFTSTR